MSDQAGEFIWYELMTPDVPAALEFYGAVTGWQARRADNAAAEYHLLGTGKADIGGVIRHGSDAPGGRAGWLGYIGVDDTDAAHAAIVKAGGAQHVPPTDIPGIGRFAVVGDPQGAIFYIMRGAVDARSTAFAPDTVGHCQWNELSTSDPAAALAFYGGCFGWTKGDAMPMGEMGDYQFLSHHGQTFGAVMALPPGGDPSRWRFYFGVADIDAATAAVTGNGGVVQHGPTEIPGGFFMIIASDPQGAEFGLVGSRNG
jgi:predicted enzyme related to lactoylglutathione lyase